MRVSLVTVNQIRRWTLRDPTMAKVLQFVLQGWPTTVETELLPYSRRRNELNVQDNCLLWGNRVVIPPPRRDSILCLLHDTHPDISKIKSLARSYVWWPGIDKALEDEVHHCESCQQQQNFHLRHYYIRGNGLNVHGLDCTLTLQDHLWVTTSYLWWMRILNG